MIPKSESKTDKTNKSTTTTTTAITTIDMVQFYIDKNVINREKKIL